MFDKEKQPSLVLISVKRGVSSPKPLSGALGELVANFKNLTLSSVLKLLSTSQNAIIVG